MTWNCPEILVVDDSVTDQVRTSGLIRRFQPNSKVASESSCEAAIERLKNESFDIVVTDLVMPGKNGQDLLEILQQLSPPPAVILVTSQGSERLAAECLRRGAIAYLRKSNLAADLEGVLEETRMALKETALHQTLMGKVFKASCEFEIASDLNQIQALSNFLIQRLHATTMLESESLQRVIGSVREALLNAYFHGSMQVNEFPLQHSRSDYASIAEQKAADPDLSSRRIGLTMSHDDRQLSITIRDQGGGFDSSIATSLPHSADDRGMGLRTILSSMSEVRWSESGNEITLISSDVALKASGRLSGSTNGKAGPRS